MEDSRDESLRTFLASEIAREAATVVGGILRKNRPELLSDEFFRSDHLVTWETVARSGILMLGAPIGRGGADASLMDLTLLAAEWGRHLLPLPATLTMVVLRHGALADTWLKRPMTVPLPMESNLSVVPFLKRPNVLCVTSLTEPLELDLDSVDQTAEDGFAPSLPRHVVRMNSPVNGRFLAELLTLYAAEATGCAAEALDVTIRYALGRIQFGQPIAKFQAVKHRLANMYCDLELARTAVLWSAQAQDDPSRGSSEALNLCRRVVEGSIQLHGGIGFTWEAGLHFYLRHIVALTDLIVGTSRSIEGLRERTRR